MKKLIFYFLFSTTITSYSQVGINTEEPTATLEVNGDVKIKRAENITGNAKILYIDPNGLVGTKTATGDAITADVFYAQTNREVVSASTTFNDASKIVLTFVDDDIAYNTLGITVDNGAFKIGTSGVYEITSFINFNIYAATGANLFITVALEMSTNGGSSWTNVTGSRPIFTKLATTTNQNTPNILPSALTYLEAGTLLRLYFKRSNTTHGDDVSSILVTGASGFATKAFQLTIKKL